MSVCLFHLLGEIFHLLPLSRMWGLWSDCPIVHSCCCTPSAIYIVKDALQRRDVTVTHLKLFLCHLQLLSMDVAHAEAQYLLLEQH